MTHFRPLPRLIAITDLGRAPRARWLQQLEALCGAALPGTVAVQLREPLLAVRERLAFGAALRELTRAREQRLWINDRLDLALLLGADGAHLTERSVAVADARRLLGAERVVTLARHALEPDAEACAADAVLLSPVFEPRKSRAPLGAPELDRYRRALHDAGAPAAKVYALGGVTAENAREALAAGAVGVAVIGAALADDASPLLDALEIHR